MSASPSAETNGSPEGLGRMRVGFAGEQARIMRTTEIHPSQYRRMPWKNGRGETIEIARAPREGEFDWRVSIATVDADGPFSTFPGCDRVIVILEGAGMILAHREVGTEVSVGSLEPWSFRGDWTTHCMLRDGPVRDFNVITRRNAVEATVSVLRIHGARTIGVAPRETLLYGVAGEVICEGDPPVTLEAGHTLILERSDDGGQATLRSSTTAVALQIDLHDSSATRRTS